MSRVGFLEEVAMKDKTGGNRGPRCAGALAVAAAVAVLATACGGGGSSSVGSDSADSATYRADVAFVQCLRSHGAPQVPDPRPGHSISVQVNGSLGSGPMAQAVGACRPLLPRGSTTTTSGHVTSQQVSQALKVVQCLRSKGEPNFPEPTVANGKLNFPLQPGVLQSTQFQAALNACRSLIPKGFQVP